MIAGCAVAATVGVSACASAAGDDEAARAVDPQAAATTVAAPGARRDAPAWVLAPTREGGVCVTTTSLAFCGSDRASVEEGRAAATEYPPDRIVGTDLESGNAIVRPADGTGVRSGIAPTGATTVAVIDRDGRTLRRADVVDGAYEIAVPAQGSRARVAFLDGDGKTIASRPA